MVPRSRLICSQLRSATSTASINPGHVKLKPGVLKECQDAVVKAHGEGARFHLVFHGGSGSALSEIHEALDYGVVKMNVDTDI
jgi:fructose-bisphosphate aldolase class II